MAKSNKFFRLLTYSVSLSVRRQLFLLNWIKVMTYRLRPDNRTRIDHTRVLVFHHFCYVMKQMDCFPWMEIYWFANLYFYQWPSCSDFSYTRDISKSLFLSYSYIHATNSILPYDANYGFSIWKLLPGCFW